MKNMVTKLKLILAQQIRQLASSASSLETQVAELRRENTQLTEALHTLHESAETKTQHSGTESEINRLEFIH